MDEQTEKLTQTIAVIIFGMFLIFMIGNTSNSNTTSLTVSIDVTRTLTDVKFVPTSLKYSTGWFSGGEVQPLGIIPTKKLYVNFYLDGDRCSFEEFNMDYLKTKTIKLSCKNVEYGNHQVILELMDSEGQEDKIMQSINLKK